MILDYFTPVEGGINLYYGRVGNGKTYNATADILALARAGHVILCNWKIDVEDFDSLKMGLTKSTPKGLMFIIMLANGELMDRCDKNTLQIDFYHAQEDNKA